MSASLVKRRLCKVRAPDRKAIYSTLRKTPTLIVVLENGSREVQSQKVTRNDNALYEVDKGWLVEVTSPREIKSVAREKAERAKRGRERAAASRDPAFRRLLVDMEAAFGAPSRVRACDVSMWSFAAPTVEDDGWPWIDRAPSEGGAVTRYLAPDGAQLRVVSGRTSRLAALFDWNYYGDGTLVAALDAIDDDAGLSFDFIEDADHFALHVDRVPKRIDLHARALANAFDMRPAPIATALRKRRWLVA